MTTPHDPPKTTLATRERVSDERLNDLEERLALWCQIREPAPLVKLSSVKEMLDKALIVVRELQHLRSQPEDPLTADLDRISEALYGIDRTLREVTPEQIDALAFELYALGVHVPPRDTAFFHAAVRKWLAELATSPAPEAQSGGES